MRRGARTGHAAPVALAETMNPAFGRCSAPGDARVNVPPDRATNLVPKLVPDPAETTPSVGTSRRRFGSGKPNQPGGEPLVVQGSGVRVPRRLWKRLPRAVSLSGGSSAPRKVPKRSRKSVPRVPRRTQARPRLVRTPSTGSPTDGQAQAGRREERPRPPARVVDARRDPRSRSERRQRRPVRQVGLSRLAVLGVGGRELGDVARARAGSVVVGPAVPAPVASTPENKSDANPGRLRNLRRCPARGPASGSGGAASHLVGLALRGSVPRREGT